MINILYSALVYDQPQGTDWFDKKRSVLFLSDKAKTILASIVSHVPYNKRKLFASVICCTVKDTIFCDEILQQDPCNTYVPCVRPPDALDKDSTYCMVDCCAPEDSYKSIKAYLDTDIADRLNSVSWLTHMAGYCLQLLREIV